MAKLTLSELNAIRDREAKNMRRRDIEGRDHHIVVAMGTSGIENGAKLILDTFALVVEEKNLDNVIITQSDALKGVLEPSVQIHTPKTGLVTYQNVSKKDVLDIVEKTVIGGEVIPALVVDYKEEE